MKLMNAGLKDWIFPFWYMQFYIGTKSWTDILHWNWSISDIEIYKFFKNECCVFLPSVGTIPKCLISCIFFLFGICSTFKANSCKNNSVLQTIFLDRIQSYRSCSVKTSPFTKLENYRHLGKIIGTFFQGNSICSS